ncbi:MAG: Hsp70 family protein [Clostridia bacterium]|nr:Hsp70 family protein [Clostridia bacterium]
MASFGIDFGTTNTSVVECLITEHGMTKTPYGENNQPFPSLVALHPDKQPVFGWEVKKRRSQLIAEGYHVVASFKSILGSDQRVVVGKKEYSPVDVTALFLSYVKHRVEGMAGRKLEETVMAIPVDFKPEQRRSLRTAAEKAGIKIKSFVSEPTAAYVNCRQDLAGASNVAVFDWGGGTLDISLISIDKHEVSELAVTGQRLGGNDIDQMLARHLHAKISRQEGDPRTFDDLTPAERDQILERAEEAKKRLSTDDTAPIRLMRYAGKVMIRDIVTLDEFSKLIASRIDDAESLLHAAAEKAGVGIGQMDAILMVGGSCEMQPIFQRLERISEEYHLSIYRPDGIQWAVAGGAAVLSEQQPAYKLQKAFGVLLSDDSFYPVFEAGQVVPCKAQELRFGVVEDTTSAVFVFADESKVVLKRRSVPIKGFTAEGIHLQCEIDGDMIVHLRIFSDYAERMAVTDELNQLGFTYQIQ